MRTRITGKGINKHTSGLIKHVFYAQFKFSITLINGKLLQHLDDWSFDVFALAESGNCQPVKYVGYDLLNRYGMIHKFKVPSATLETFLTRIEEGRHSRMLIN